MKSSLAFNKFGHSEYTFVVMGWIPKKFLGRMKKAVKKTFGGRVIISEARSGVRRDGEGAHLL